MGTEIHTQPLPPPPRDASADTRLSWSSGLGVLGLLLLVALLLRVPFFFPAVIDWDESSFVLMGQALLDGHLPYVTLWDNKSPLSSAFYALAIAVFGRDVVGIRVAGALCLTFAAFLVYLTGRRVWNHHAGLMAAILSIAGASLLPHAQATMTELVVLPPLVGALYLLIRSKAAAGTWFLAGALLGSATLVRLNLGFVVIAAGLYLWAAAAEHGPMAVGTFVRLTAGCVPIAAGLSLVAGSALRASTRPFLARLVAYAAGGMLVAGATWLPYALAAQQATLWNSAVVAAVLYSRAQYSVAESLVGLVRASLGSPVALLWAGALGSLVVIWRRWERMGDAERRGATLLVLFLCGTGAGILESGGAYEHYLIQAVPFAALLSAGVVHEAARGAFLDPCGGRKRW